jgi:hypothetical protein
LEGIGSVGVENGKEVELVSENDEESEVARRLLRLSLQALLLLDEEELEGVSEGRCPR